MNATHIAHGFGIRDRNIVYIEDQTEQQIMNIILNIKIEFRDLGMKGFRTFLLVYCAGHGLADQE